MAIGFLGMWLAGFCIGAGLVGNLMTKFYKKDWIDPDKGK